MLLPFVDGAEGVANRCDSRQLFFFSSRQIYSHEFKLLLIASYSSMLGGNAGISVYLETGEEWG